MQQQKNAFLTDLNTIFENFKENIDILKLFIFIKHFSLHNGPAERADSRKSMEEFRPLKAPGDFLFNPQFVKISCLIHNGII